MPGENEDRYDPREARHREKLYLFKRRRALPPEAGQCAAPAFCMSGFFLPGGLPVLLRQGNEDGQEDRHGHICRSNEEA